MGLTRDAPHINSCLLYSSNRPKMSINRLLSIDSLGDHEAWLREVSLFYSDRSVLHIESEGAVVGGSTAGRTALTKIKDLISDRSDSLPSEVTDIRLEQAEVDLYLAVKSFLKGILGCVAAYQFALDDLKAINHIADDPRHQHRRMLNKVAIERFDLYIKDDHLIGRYGKYCWKDVKALRLDVEKDLATIEKRDLEFLQAFEKLLKWKWG